MGRESEVRPVRGERRVRFLTMQRGSDVTVLKSFSVVEQQCGAVRERGSASATARTDDTHEFCRKKV